MIAALAAWSAVSGVRDCGISEHPDIRYRTDPLLPIGSGRSTIYLKPSGIPGGWVNGWCDMAMPAVTGEHEIRHEVGHCLGLDHPDFGVDAVMASGGWGSRPVELQPDDIAGIQSIYGPRVQPLAYRAMVSVGRE